MLIYSAEHVDGWHSSPRSIPMGNEKNMALESFLLHFRNLRAFLCPSLQRPQFNDILASDFLGELVPRDIGSAAKLSEDKDRLDRMLAHLTYHRDQYIAAGEDRWLAARMGSDALAEFEAFLSSPNLKPKIASWFPSRSQLAQERSRLASLAILAGEAKGE
jgi:hypothetical protein